MSDTTTPVPKAFQHRPRNTSRVRWADTKLRILEYVQTNPDATFEEVVAWIAETFNLTRNTATNYLREVRSTYREAQS